MTPFDISAVRGLLTHDCDGRATRALIRCLRAAAEPLSQALQDSLSPEDHQLRQRLLEDARQAELSLATAWKRLHPGRALER
jgi:hypothetical protein